MTAPSLSNSQFQWHVGTSGLVLPTTAQGTVIIQAKLWAINIASNPGYLPLLNTKHVLHTSFKPNTVLQHQFATFL